MWIYKNATQYEWLPSRWVRALLLHQRAPTERIMPKAAQLYYKTLLEMLESDWVCTKVLVRYLTVVSSHQWCLVTLFCTILLNRLQEQQSGFFSSYVFLHWSYFHTLSFWTSSAKKLPLALKFSSCQRVFDNTNRETMWHILEIYSLLCKAVQILKDFC